MPYEVKVPERYTFAQQRLAAYHVARNAITNIVSKLASQRSGHFARSILQRGGRRTSTCALFTSVNSHHRQGEFFIICDDFYPRIVRKRRRVNTTIPIGAYLT